MKLGLAASLVAHVDVMVVAERLWYVPVYAMIALTLYALTVHLSGRPWAGVLACAVLAIPSSVRLVRWFLSNQDRAYIPVSPSELLGLPVLLKRSMRA